MSIIIYYCYTSTQITCTRLVQIGQKLTNTHCCPRTVDRARLEPSQRFRNCSIADFNLGQHFTNFGSKISTPVTRPICKLIV